MYRIKRLLKEKVGYKKLVLAGILVFIGLYIVPGLAHASSGYTPSEPPGVIEKGLSALLRAFAEGIDSTIIKVSGKPLDKLVYNTGINTNTEGLTLLISGDLSNYFIDIYATLKWIAAAFFVPMGLVVAIDFMRSQENAQHRAVLKDRLLKVIATVILITSMPMLLDIIFRFNNVMISVFHDLAAQKLVAAQANGSLTDGTLLIGAFKAHAQASKTFMDSAIYLMSVILNIWMIFYYMVRDLTISFLFMLFPIIAIFYPFKKGMVGTWFKEMASNILTQSIHAMIISVVIGMAATFGGKSPNLYQQLFVALAFASTIPMTATIKRFLGLEGSVGAASSMAGLGAMMGAMALAQGAFSSVKGGVSNIKQGVGELRDLKTMETASDKNVGIDGVSDNDKELSPVNALNSGGLSREEMLGKRRDAKKKIMQGATGLAGAGSFGMVGTVGGSVFGAKGAMGGMALGTIVGEHSGARVGGAAYGIGANIAENSTNIAYGVGQRPELSGITEGNEAVFEGGLAHSIATGNFVDDITNFGSVLDNNISNMKDNFVGNQKSRKDLFVEQRKRSQEQKVELANKYTGVSNDIMNSDPEFQSQERRAVATKKKYESLGQPDKAWRAYAKLTPQRTSVSEMEKLEGLNMYRDKDMSVAYTEENGARKVHWVGGGVEGMRGYSLEGVSFNDGSSELSNQRVQDFEVQASDYVTNTLNIPKVDKKFDSAKNQHFNSLVKVEQERIAKLRTELGSNFAYSGAATRIIPSAPIVNDITAQQKQSVEKLQVLSDQSAKLQNEMRNMSVNNDKVSFKEPSATRITSL
jgi:hypothetical protein